MAIRLLNWKAAIFLSSRRRCHFFCSLVVVSAIILISFLLLSPYTSQSFPQLKNSARKSNDEILVLFWTSYYHSIDYVGFESERYWFSKKAPDNRITDNVYDGPFHRCENPVARRCVLTNNRSLLQQSAAVIFHIRDLHLSIDMPWYRSPQQRWVFYLHESPIYTRQNFNQHLANLPNLPDQLRFNRTMTYRMDSDIVSPYSPRIGEFRRRLSKEKELIQSLPGLINGKTKLAAWMVSNCFSGERKLYVDELKKYIEIDVYGGCGPLKCYDNKTHPYACNEMLERDYKFYLAFENSKCRDYVTEKFYNALLFSVVPVVFGGADYDAIGAPKNSYIDVRIFASPKHLADYLRFLDVNPDAYLRYFDWRLNSHGLSSLRRYEPWCEICEKLADDKEIYQSSNSKSYQDIYSWWFNSNQCL